MSALADWLCQTEECLYALGARKDGARLTALRAGLDSPQLRVVVFGEFNRGKSTLINALLRRLVLPARLVPTTGHTTRVVHGSPEEVRVTFVGGRYDTCPLASLDSFVSLTDGLAREDVDDVEVAVAVPLLERGLVLLDTPGVSDEARQTERARAAVERADLVLLLLDATQLLSHYERDLAVGWIIGDLGKPLVPVLNRMNLVEPNERADIRRRMDRWCAVYLPPVLGKPWYEVNALAAARHVLGIGPEPSDDFPALSAALGELIGEPRRTLQKRSRRGSIVAVLRELREGNERTLTDLRTDSERTHRQRQERRRHLANAVRRLETAAILQLDRLAAVAGIQLRLGLDWLLAQLRGKSNDELKGRFEEWYEGAAREVARRVEKEAAIAVEALAAEADMGRPDPLTIVERLTLNARFRVESHLATGIRKILGNIVTDWIERVVLRVDHTKPFLEAAETKWEAYRGELLGVLHAQVRARVDALRRHADEQREQLDAIDHIPEEAIKQRAYELWVLRGYLPGEEERHWADAEKELRARCQPEAREILLRERLEAALTRCEGELD